MRFLGTIDMSVDTWTARNMKMIKCVAGTACNIEIIPSGQTGKWRAMGGIKKPAWLDADIGFVQQKMLLAQRCVNVADVGLTFSLPCVICSCRCRHSVRYAMGYRNNGAILV